MPMVSRNPSCRLAAALAAFALLLPVTVLRAEESKKDFSPAEKALFMNDQFASLKPPLTLHYQFHRTGSLEPAFDDTANISLSARSTGGCCAASGEFLTGARKVPLPPVDGAAGNPVTLFFLERDIHEMQRLTKGQPNYFRKRIRMAIYQGAQQRDVTLRYRGKPVTGQEFTITPYVDDPNRTRFEKLAVKQYVFTVSDAVPGGVYAIRTVVPDGDAGGNAPPLIAEELLIDGAESTSGGTSPRT